MTRCARLLFLAPFLATACASESPTSTGTPYADGGQENDGSVPVDATAPVDATSSNDGARPRDATPGNDANGPTDGGPFTTPGADTTVTLFNGTLVCFGSGGTGPCSRTVDTTALFPTTGAYTKILLHVTLDCPSNGCDPWDRFGSIAIVKPGATGGETLLELGRFVTPYGITPGVNNPPAWDIDVTELRPLLVGSQTVRVFIDTWVPQGNPAQYGGGWVVGAMVQMTGGMPAKVPQAVLPLWAWQTTNKEPTQIVYGDARYPIATSLPPQTMALPAGMTSWTIRSFITGHGQANLDNCSEFCSRNHSWTVGGSTATSTVWRTDCANYPSQGTYQYSRAGWCPGADVVPWDADVSSQVSGPSATFTYGVDAYVNTCNGDAPDGGLCTGCPAGGSCAYNGGSHTQPFYYVSSLLVGFR
jgi:hypothetical protein